MGAMNPKPKMTKQGLRNLNYYGPKPSKTRTASGTAAPEGERSVSPPVVPEKSDAPPPAGA